MTDFIMKSTAPLDKNTLLSDSQMRVQGAWTAQNVTMINKGRAYMEQGTAPSRSPAPVTNAPAVADRPIPPLQRTAQKGQKLPLETAGKLSQVSACLGWNVKNPQCDVDVSAFLLGNNGKVLGDTWFVFYGQTKSPDGSTIFSAGQGADREAISIDLTRLNPSVEKIVFVLTINDAIQNHLNFSMVKDAYIRILNHTGTELVSFMMDEYYSNVTSMMIGEMYRHNGAWKFNAIGSGVARDLAGLCELYGVQVE